MRIILGVEIPFHVEHVTFHITLLPWCLPASIWPLPARTKDLRPQPRHSQSFNHTFYTDPQLNLCRLPSFMILKYRKSSTPLPKEACPEALATISQWLPEVGSEKIWMHWRSAWSLVFRSRYRDDRRRACIASIGSIAEEDMIYIPP